ENIKARIQLFKDFNHYTKHVLKVVIYGIEVALNYFWAKNKRYKSSSLVLEIQSIDLRTRLSDDILIYTIVKGIWFFLGFKPEEEIEIFTKQKPFKIVEQIYTQDFFILKIPFLTDNKYVSRNHSIDEKATNHFLWIDDEAFEKGREFQWLV
ncbi:MAG: hypothetical protein AAF960_29710, partial [Bacteroidota bacterium]